MNRTRMLLMLLLSLSLCSCKNSSRVITAEENRRLNTTADIVVEIENEHAIECDPYLSTEDGIARIELNVTDSKSDYESLVPKISKLQSVQSFDGELHLVFSTRSELTTRTLAKYNAKTGLRID